MRTPPDNSIEARVLVALLRAAMQVKPLKFVLCLLILTGYVIAHFVWYIVLEIFQRLRPR